MNSETATHPAVKIQLVARSYQQMIGLARYTTSLCEAMDELHIAYSLARLRQPALIKAAHSTLKPLGYDVESFFNTYPLSLSSLNGAALTHMMAQQMATLLWLKPNLHPAVITVHDIVPFLVRSDKSQTTFRHPFDSLFDQLAMSGLKRAEALIADSAFTRQTLVSALNCDADKIFVVPLGVRHELFRPVKVTEAFYDRFGLDPALHYLLYVGSENPRKNLTRLVEAFGQVQRRLPHTRLIKIGSAEYTVQAEQLRRQIKEQGLQEKILFVDHVADEDLVRFYNIADLFVFPSLFEGFGLPPLEAMACGTPVVSSNAASLPEVVGDAALIVDPYNVEEIATAICRVLEEKELAAELKAAGLARAQEFSWERTARETIAVYETVLGMALNCSEEVVDPCS